MHLDKLTRLKMAGVNLRGGCEAGKAIVMGLLERETGEARATPK